MKIKAEWKRIKLNYMPMFTKNQYYEYKTKNDIEKSILKNNSEIIYMNYWHTETDIIFCLTNKQLRKIKLGYIIGKKDDILLKKIISESKIINNMEYIIEKQLSNELAESIDKEIIKGIKNYINQ